MQDLKISDISYFILEKVGFIPLFNILYRHIANIAVELAPISVRAQHIDSASMFASLAIASIVWVSSVYKVAELGWALVQMMLPV